MELVELKVMREDNDGFRKDSNESKTCNVLYDCLY